MYPEGCHALLQVRENEESVIRVSCCARHMGVVYTPSHLDMLMVTPHVSWREMRLLDERASWHQNANENPGFGVLVIC